MNLINKVNNSLTGRALLYSMGNIALNFLSVVSAPLFVRMMSPAEYGSASVFITWVGIASAIVGLKIDGTLYNAKSEFGEELLPAYCSSNLFLSIVFSLCLVVFAQFAPGNLLRVLGFDYGWVLVLAVVVSLCTAISNIRLIYLTITRRAFANMLVSLCLAFGQVVLSLVLLGQISDGFLARVFGYSLPLILLGFIVCISIYIHGRKLVSPRFWSFCLALSVPLIFNSIGYLIINQSDRLIINSMLGSAAAGIYSFAYSTSLPIGVISSSLNSAWTPEFFDYLDNDKESELVIRANRYFINFTFIGACLMLVSPEVLKILGTTEYYDGLTMVPAVVLAYYYQFLFTWPVNYETYFKQTKVIAISTIIAAIVNIFLTVLLVKAVGVIGAAFASLLSFALLFFIHHVFSIKTIDRYPFKLSWYMRGAIPMTVCMFMVTIGLDCVVFRWISAMICLAVFVNRVRRAGLF